MYYLILDPKIEIHIFFGGCIENLEPFSSQKNFIVTQNLSKMQKCRETGSRQFSHGKREVQNLRDPGNREGGIPPGRNTKLHMTTAERLSCHQSNEEIKVIFVVVFSYPEVSMTIPFTSIEAQIQIPKEKKKDIFFNHFDFSPISRKRVLKDTF